MVCLHGEADLAPPRAYRASTAFLVVVIGWHSIQFRGYFVFLYLEVSVIWQCLFYDMIVGFNIGLFVVLLVIFHYTLTTSVQALENKESRKNVTIMH